MNKVKTLLQLLESTTFDLATHDIQNLKTKIHNHQIAIRTLQTQPPKDPAVKNRRLNFHKKAIDHLVADVKKRQDSLHKLNHSAAGASAGKAGNAAGHGHGGRANSSVNNLGEIPVGPLNNRKTKLKR